jgi:hypothetical protein
MNPGPTAPNEFFRSLAKGGHPRFAVERSNKKAGPSAPLKNAPLKDDKQELSANSDHILTEIAPHRYFAAT